MRKHYVFITILLLCGFMLGGVVAQADQERKQNGSENGSTSTVSEPSRKQDKAQEQTKEQAQTQESIQEQKRERTNQDEETPCFTAEDGNTYRWQYRFSRKLRRIEEQGDEEAAYKYLEKIASRYNFEYNSDADDFIHWAVQNRPWDTE